MPETIPPISESCPQTYSLKRYVRTQELSIAEIITQMGDLTGLGRGVIFGNKFDPQSTLPTGQGLCVLTTTIAESALRQRHNNLVVVTEIGNVMTFNSPPKPINPTYKFVHAWNQFQFAGETPFFLDMTFGQVNPLLNRIVLDQEDKKQYYYPGLKTFGELASTTIESALERHHNVIARISRKLSKPEKIQLRDLAFRMEDILAA